MSKPKTYTPIQALDEAIMASFVSNHNKRPGHKLFKICQKI